MGRSNKEARLNHSGLSIGDGHGGLKRNTVEVKSEKSDSMKRAEAQQGKSNKSAKTPGQQKADDEMMEADAGWDAIGKAGASMVQTYKAKNAKGTSGSK